MYEEAGDLYAGLENIGKTEKTLLRALEFLERKLKTRPGDNSVIINQSEILQILSRNFYEEDETEKANKYAMKACTKLIQKNRQIGRAF